MKPLIIVLFALCSIPAGFASEASGQKPLAAAGASVRQAMNTLCPVSGDPVGSVGKPVYADYGGKAIAFCCKGCAKKFRMHPDKYGPLAENNQTAHEPM